MEAGCGRLAAGDGWVMSKRGQIQRHLGTLKDIGGIMGAMKNISLMETHKLSRFLAHQHRVLAGIEAAAGDFLVHHPEIDIRPQAIDSSMVVAIGSQRGFCGDFNESLAEALHQHWHQTSNNRPHILVVGRRLAAKLHKDLPVSAVFDGPSVAEEVPTVMQRLTDTLVGLQSSTKGQGLLSISVFAQREGENQVSPRAILPVPDPAAILRRHPYPPLLNIAAKEFFAQLVRHYLWAQMHDVFYSSLMAENRRRLQHMEGAMQRMDENANELRRKVNLLRQEEITEEIEVIMLSNEALRRSRLPRSGAAK